MDEERYIGRIVAKSSHDQHDPKRGFVRYITGDVIEMTPREKAWLVDELGHVEIVPDDTPLSAGATAAEPHYASELPDPSDDGATAYTGPDAATPDASTPPATSDEPPPGTPPPTEHAAGSSGLVAFGAAGLMPYAVEGLTKAGIEETHVANLPDDTLLAISGIAERSLVRLRELYGGPPKEEA